MTEREKQEIYRAFDSVSSKMGPREHIEKNVPCWKANYEDIKYVQEYEIYSFDEVLPCLFHGPLRKTNLNLIQCRHWLS